MEQNKTSSLKTENEQVSQNAYHSDAFLLYTKTSEIETKN